MTTTTIADLEQLVANSALSPQQRARAQHLLDFANKIGQTVAAPPPAIAQKAAGPDDPTPQPPIPGLPA